MFYGINKNFYWKFVFLYLKAVHNIDPVGFVGLDNLIAKVSEKCDTQPTEAAITTIKPDSTTKKDDVTTAPITTPQPGNKKVLTKKFSYHL